MWELGSAAHCPVIGVCLPIAALRRLVDRVIGEPTPLGDYEVHCSAVSKSGARSSIANALQKELDRRHADEVRRAALAKTTEALACLWQDAVHSCSIAGRLWAVLTHPRCTPELEKQVISQVHMLQHQAGAASRVDLARLDGLIDENAILTAELARNQKRTTDSLAESASKAAALDTELCRLRGELAARDAALALALDELQSLREATPHLGLLENLTQEKERLTEQLGTLRKEMSSLRAAFEAGQRRTKDPVRPFVQEPTPAVGTLPSTGQDEAAHGLANRTVLCVGGRSALVPAYRERVERAGARFLHHDGGEEQSIHRLDSTLAAADLVICQTGCISHDAYWRLKDHCKRTGKPCVFVKSPGSSSLTRALRLASQEAKASSP